MSYHITDPAENPYIICAMCHDEIGCTYDTSYMPDSEGLKCICTECVDGEAKKLKITWDFVLMGGQDMSECIADTMCSILLDGEREVFLSEELKADIEGSAYDEKLYECEFKPYSSIEPSKLKNTLRRALMEECECGGSYHKEFAEYLYDNHN